MSDLHPFPNDTAQAADNGFLFTDWELPEKSLSEVPPPFDGKIIARMPDLGSDNFTQNIEKTKFPTFWETVGLSIASMIQGNSMPTNRFSRATRQRFFLRFATIGSVVLLCGIGILFLEWENKPSETDNNFVEMLISEIPERTTDSKVDSIIASAPQSESHNIAADIGVTATLPAAPVENVAIVPPPSADNSPGHAKSVWDRPVADEYSPWGIVPRQPENQPTKVASAENLLTMPPQKEAVALSPMIDMSMQISPYEQQLLARANVSAQPPVDPFIQQNGYVVPGMIPMRERQENPPGIVTANTRQAVVPPYNPQYVPPEVAQGMHPPQYSQYNLQAVPPPNMPIPSGPSTLPQGQGVYYQQPPGPASPMPSHASDFYHAPPTHRRVY